MTEIGIGIVGGGYMGKAHAIAMSAVGAVFNTSLRPRLEMVAGSTPASGEKYRAAYGFRRAARNWQELVNDPAVEAVVIAATQDMHREIAEAALALGKPVLCEKPLGASLVDSAAMVAAADRAGVANMVGFNYIRTPASQYARALVADGTIGDVVYFRGEHTEDFFADPNLPANWRTETDAAGCLGDLSPHMINAARALIGPIASVMADLQTVTPIRGGVVVKNDDQAQMLVRFENEVPGHLFFSRAFHGRKMGYIYEISGTKGTIRFDGEDQNSIQLYLAEGPEAQRGFRKILTGPAHPDYLPFCQGPGHGTGYNDQIIIEARDFLTAIETGTAVWPTFREGHEVNRVIAAARASHKTRIWQDIKDF